MRINNGISCSSTSFLYKGHNVDRLKRDLESSTRPTIFAMAIRAVLKSKPVHCAWVSRGCSGMKFKGFRSKSRRPNHHTTCSKHLPDYNVFGVTFFAWQLTSDVPPLANAIECAVELSTMSIGFIWLVAWGRKISPKTVVLYTSITFTKKFSFYFVVHKKIFILFCCSFPCKPHPQTLLQKSAHSNICIDHKQ